MPPTVAPDGKSKKVWMRRVLREVLAGREDPEGFFTLCFSVLGHQETRSHSQQPPALCPHLHLQRIFLKGDFTHQRNGVVLKNCYFCASQSFRFQVKANVMVMVGAEVKLFWMFLTKLVELTTENFTKIVISIKCTLINSIYFCLVLLLDCVLL